MYPEKLEVLAMLYRINQPLNYLDFIKHGNLSLTAALNLTEDGLVRRIMRDSNNHNEPSESHYELTRKGKIYFYNLMEIASMLS